MIRVLTTDEPTAITITLDGQLIDESVDAVEISARQAMASGKPVHVFLRDVSHIDARGRSLLSRLAGRGVHLSAAGIYSSYVVEEINRGRPQTVGT